MNAWHAPHCESRTGAFHQRSSVPCQDASGWQCFQDAEGLPVHVLVVSDGHGGARYVRSRSGSELACRVALLKAQQSLAPGLARLPDGRDEREAWLAKVLMPRIVAGWRQAVQEHWQNHSPGDGSPFAWELYGATLGLLLLTPRWWGHSGLGDWDLVRIGAEGGTQLLSEESGAAGRGEATFSLCLDDAVRRCPPRTAVHDLRPGAGCFSLLLSTDGLRKSCGSDADFLTLARYLVKLPVVAACSAAADDGQELPAALDHISRQGSGDDISVAIAHWGPVLSQPQLARSGRLLEEAVIVQPPAPITLPSRNGPQAKPAVPPGVADPGVADPDVKEGAGAAELVEASAVGESLRKERRLQPGLAWLLATAALFAATVVLLNRMDPRIAIWSRNEQAAQPPPETGPARAVLAREVTRLCSLQAIDAELLQRKASFARLLNLVSSPEQAANQRPAAHETPAPSSDPREAPDDPLSALIAWSHDPRSPGAVQSQRLVELRACPALIEAFDRRWRETLTEAGGQVPESVR